MTADTAELFPATPYRVAPEPVPDRTEGQKRRDRQALRIARGLHPLSINGMKIPLHADAPRDAAKDDPRDYPRCGSCAFRVQVGWHTRNYPKCVVGSEADPYAAPRYSTGEDTDVRGWWPACLNFKLAPRRRPGAS